MTEAIKGVAPRLRHYYCEQCKEYVLPIDADERLELVVSFETVTVTETMIARHKKCGNVLKEKFWDE